MGELGPRKKGMSAPLALVLGFLAIILLGALLLTLPQASQSGGSVGLLTALFTATSATCVTGLVVVDTATSYTLFGQIVILCLIQVGGLGFMMFATATLVALGKRVSLHNRMLIRESMSMPGLSGGVRTVQRFMVLAFTLEGLGALLLALRFVPLYGWAEGIYKSVFHAISAFCNAGFDLFGAAGSLSAFRADPLVLMTVSLLIVLGGIGFAVIWDVVDHRARFKGLTLHSKIVLFTTGALLLFGWITMGAIEWRNPLTLATPGAGAGEKVLNAWFQSVTTRTAGYYSVSQGGLTDASKVITTMLMMLGASPASTGGGIKTSTFFVVLLVLGSIVRNREDVNAFGRRLSPSIARTAQSILFIYLALLTLGAVLMALFEGGKGFSLLDLVFEQTSALGTVGLSAVGTEKLSTLSRVWLILLMYFGRVGPLTMMLTFSRDTPLRPGAIRYPQERIIVG